VISTVEADNPAPSEQGSSPAQGRHEYLRETRVQAESGTPASTTVRGLIALCGAKVRSHRLNQEIAAALANHGLSTTPNFRKVALDTRVQIVEVAPEEDELTSGAAGAAMLLDDDEELDAGL